MVSKLIGWWLHLPQNSWTTHRTGGRSGARTFFLSWLLACLCSFLLSFSKQHQWRDAERVVAHHGALWKRQETLALHSWRASGILLTTSLWEISYTPEVCLLSWGPKRGCWTPLELSVDEKQEEGSSPWFSRRQLTHSCNRGIGCCLGCFLSFFSGPDKKIEHPEKTEDQTKEKGEVIAFPFGISEA